MAMTKTEFKGALEELAAVVDMLPEETRILSGSVDRSPSGKNWIQIEDGLDQLAAAVQLPVDAHKFRRNVHKSLDFGTVVLIQVERPGGGTG